MNEQEHIPQLTLDPRGRRRGRPEHPCRPRRPHSDTVARERGTD